MAIANETRFGACPHDCPDTRSMLYKVADGRLLDVRGNPDHLIGDPFFNRVGASVRERTFCGEAR